MSESTPPESTEASYVPDVLPTRPDVGGPDSTNSALASSDVPGRNGTRLGRAWRLFRRAIRGSPALDYTTCPINQAIVMLAVPMVMEMMMESLFAVTDVFWVSKLGADAVATVGLTESLLVIIYTIAMGVSIGVTALVARRVGEHNEEGAARTAVQAIALGVLISLVIGVVGGTFARDLLGLMGASDDVIGTGSRFTTIMLSGNATIVLLFLINAVFRGAGDAAIAMRVLWLGNGLNMVLDPCFMFGLGPFPELGVTGAAVATNIGRGTAVLYQLFTLARGLGRVKITRARLGFDLAVMRQVVRLSGTATIQFLIATASYVGLVRILSTFGSGALAGYTIGIRVIIFALLPSWGIANAAATLVGQNLGAGKPDRAERAVWQAAFYNAVVLGLVSAIFITFANQIVGLFSTEVGVHPFGVACLRIVSAGFLFYAYGMVLTQSFNGAGDTWTPTMINLGVFWVWEIPLAWWLAAPAGFGPGLGPQGVFVALAIAYSCLAVVSVIIFRRGRWKQTRV